jgi:hypothetical protein
MKKTAATVAIAIALIMICVPQALHPVSHAPASAISRELSFFKTAVCLIDILPDRA